MIQLVSYTLRPTHTLAYSFRITLATQEELAVAQLASPLTYFSSPRPFISLLHLPYVVPYSVLLVLAHALAGIRTTHIILYPLRV